MGRKSKLTPEVQQKIVTTLLQGGTASMSYRLAGVSRDTYYGWLSRGKGQNQGIYWDFARAVEEAEAAAQMRAIRTVQLAIVGGCFEAPVYDKDGNPIPIIDSVTGRQARDEKGRLLFVTEQKYKEPNENIAIRYLEHTSEDFGGGARGAARMHKNSDVIDIEPSQRGIFRLDMNILGQAVHLLYEHGFDLPDGYKVVRQQLPAPDDATQEAIIVNGGDDDQNKTK